MSIFAFDAAHHLGKVREVDTRKVTVLVESDEDLRKAQVGQLVAVGLSGAAEEWLIGMIQKVIKSVATKPDNDELLLAPANEDYHETVVNTVRLTLVGSIRWDPINSKSVFSRALNRVPQIDAVCNVLRDAQLEIFMGTLSASSEGKNSLKLGKYALDTSAEAYLDGNKLFQRHAALLGSTGSGKSWTVATVLENAARLPSSNIIVFDLHSEYTKLSYARQLRIPGPDELGVESDDLLYLPHWLLNSEEMQSMFIDRSEFNAHNQVMAFQNAVLDEKTKTLTKEGDSEALTALTLDSPIPYSIEAILEQLEYLNTELVEGAKPGTTKQGDFFGKFSRLIPRIKSKTEDKRYGFLFGAPTSAHEYGAMAELAKRLMDFSTDGANIKVIDFSEVPAEIRPVIVGLVARIIYQIQFWTEQTQRRPFAFICDEAHLYLPKKEGRNPVEQRAIEAFEKIAKEGRKYGASLVIVSQRPSDVSSTVLSQCNNVIALRLTNSDDQSTVKKLMPESLEGLLDALPIMDIGEALVVGDAVLLPSRIKVSEPMEKPCSSTIDFWSEWQDTHPEPDFGKAIKNMRRQGRDRSNP